MFCTLHQNKNMKTRIKFLGTFAILALTVACSKKVAPTTTDAAKEEYTGPKVTYSTDVSPIISRSCTPCHFPEMRGKKLPLDSYAAVKSSLAEMIRRVELPKDNLKFMPYDHKKQDLSAEEIEMLKNWARGGFLE